MFQGTKIGSWEANIDCRNQKKTKEWKRGAGTQNMLPRKENAETVSRNAGAQKKLPRLSFVFVALLHSSTAIVSWIQLGHSGRPGTEIWIFSWRQRRADGNVTKGAGAKFDSEKGLDLEYSMHSSLLSDQCLNMYQHCINTELALWVSCPNPGTFYPVQMTQKNTHTKQENSIPMQSFGFHFNQWVSHRKHLESVQQTEDKHLSNIPYKFTICIFKVI